MARFLVRIVQNDRITVQITARSFEEGSESRSTRLFRESDRSVLVRVYIEIYKRARSREWSRLSYDCDHYLGQTRLSVSTRSRAGSRSRRFSQVIPRLTRITRALSISLFLTRIANLRPSARSSRLTVLRPPSLNVGIGSRYPGREFRIDALCISYVRREQIYDIASRIANTL